jgi:hypothetical protein
MNLISSFKLGWFINQPFTFSCTDITKHSISMYKLCWTAFCENATGKLPPWASHFLGGMSVSENLSVQNDQFLYDSKVHPYHKGCTDVDAVVYLKAVLISRNDIPSSWYEPRWTMHRQVYNVYSQPEPGTCNVYSMYRQVYTLLKTLFQYIQCSNMYVHKHTCNMSCMHMHIRVHTCSDNAYNTYMSAMYNITFLWT